MIDWIFIAVLLCPVCCYAIAWISAMAYFRAKMSYQRKLFRELSKGD